MNTPQVLVVLLVAACFVHACVHPPLPPDYTNEQYVGVWYEIGRIQTPGGAEYQKDCICTKTTVTSDYPVWGILIAGEVPGNFNQRFPPLIRGVDYNIIWIDQDTAMEYDCRLTSTSEEYCVHFMSRTITIEPAKLQSMVDYAEGLGLNPLGIPYLSVQQEGCW
ncbi:Uncharacterized protein APZ42_020798 [Daphnia magna]|uniref:Lipocalin/cytosolic fatty-acid binding domain-containing protein n=1 Tax=Daphnia magna TaxID=35525 RepID=A0A164XE96_9CRUS|nr:Uncharacterized protein APZ42_020798 [Daphnia magna]